MTPAIPLRFTVGPRTVFSVGRRLQRAALALDAAMRNEAPVLPPLAADSHGYLITSLPAARLNAVAAGQPALVPFVRQRYERSYAALGGGFDAYLATFSAKSRSTLKRKRRKLEQACGGALDIRCCRAPADVEPFYRVAREISAKTYQERLLDSGFPEGANMLAELRERAARDGFRGWVLWIGERPAAYLYAPAEGDTLVYAYLGYDPDFADLSPGTILQAEAMRQLMDGDRFALFDFTEGEGQHKSLFRTDSVPCLDVLLLRRAPSNLMLAMALGGFDRMLSLAKAGKRRLRG